jgi:hypothetical protein
MPIENIGGCFARAFARSDAAAHVAHVGISRKIRTMNLGWQRARRMLREWALLAGLMVLLHALLFLAWAALNPGRGTPIAVIVALMLAYLVGLAASLTVFYRRVRRAASPPEFRVALEQGVLTSALVLDVAPSGWRAQQGSPVSFAARPLRREYQIRLEVTPSDGDAYDVVVAEHLTSDQAPVAGAVVQIRVHPQRPEIAVLARGTAA